MFGSNYLNAGIWPKIGAATLLAATMSVGSATAQSEGSVYVPILDRELSFEEIKAEIASEGNLVVGNWAFPTDTVMIQEFKDYIKEVYDEDIEFSYQGTFDPSIYLTQVYAAQAAGNPTPYDVLAVEENYWSSANGRGVLEDFLPSGLIPNQGMVLDRFQHAPTAIAFQASTYPAVIYNKDVAPYITQLKDLADPRLEGKVTLPMPGDITSGGFFLGLAAELGKDYTDPDQMIEVVDWAMDNIGPNVLKYTSDVAEISELLRSEAVLAAAFWEGVARAEGKFNGYPEIAMLVPPAAYLVNGYMFIPKGVEHPVRAQIWISWRLSPEVVLPNEWDISQADWATWHGGILGPDYRPNIPDWFADYDQYYPTFDQMETYFRIVDWDAYNASVDIWMDHYAMRLGQ